MISLCTTKPPQPNITQRSIIAAARKILIGMKTDSDIVLVPVPREIGIITEAQALDGPHDWDSSHYVVTFRREAGEWEAVKVV